MDESQRRREMTRVPLQIATELQAKGHRGIFGKTTDISLKGLYVTSQHLLPVNTDCHIILRIGPPEQTLQVSLEGTVVRTTDDGMAIEIRALPPDSFAHLHNLVLYNAQDAGRIDAELHNRVSRRWNQGVEKKEKEPS